jgi:outer membrane protein assembly factor BamB
MSSELRAGWRAWLIVAVLTWGMAGDLGWGQDFPGFRGGRYPGVAEQQRIPLEWSLSQNLAWKAELPGSGWSQPVVVGQRVYVTVAASAEKQLTPKNFADGVKTPQSMGMGFLSRAPEATIDWQIVCIDARTGRVLWTETLESGKPRYAVHPSNTFATESPVANAELVVAYFGAAGIVAALDSEGKLLWRREVGVYKTSNSFGTGSSLAMDDGKVYLQLHSEEKAELLCLDAASGETVWQADRETRSTSWSTPVVWVNDKRRELIVSGNQQVDSFDPSSGVLLWTVRNVKAATACSPCANAAHLYFGGSDPFSKGPLFAVAAGASGDLTPKKNNGLFENCAWRNDRGGPGMASPVSNAELLYVVDRNIIRCYDATGGAMLYQSRLPKLDMVAASPILVGDKLLVIDENGMGCVVATGPEFKVIGGGEVKDTVWATPAVANDSIFIRGLNTLYCLREQG